MWVTPQGREGLFSTWRLFVVLVSFLSRLEPLSAVHSRKSVAGLGRINVCSSIMVKSDPIEVSKAIPRVDNKEKRVSNRHST